MRFDSQGCFISGKFRVNRLFAVNSMAKIQCYIPILRDPGGERIVDVVPGGTELELKVKTGSWVERTHSQ